MVTTEAIPGATTRRWRTVPNGGTASNLELLVSRSFKRLAMSSSADEHVLRSGIAQYMASKRLQTTQTG